VTRKDLFQSLVRIGLTRKQADLAIDSFFQALVDALRAGKKVSIVGLGTWEWRERRPRLARNPKTGKRVPLAARKSLLFRPSLKFKKKLRG